MTSGLPCAGNRIVAPTSRLGNKAAPMLNMWFTGTGISARSCPVSPRRFTAPIELAKAAFMS